MAHSQQSVDKSGSSFDQIAVLSADNTNVNYLLLGLQQPEEETERYFHCAQCAMYLTI